MFIRYYFMAFFIRSSCFCVSADAMPKSLGDGGMMLTTLLNYLLNYFDVLFFCLIYFIV